MIDLINIDSSAWKIIVGRKNKGSRGAFVIQNARLRRLVGVVGKESNLIFFLLRSENDEGVINGELREPYYMHYQRRAIWDFRQEHSGHVLLLATAKRKNYPPMAALNIAMPGGPTFGFQQILLGLTK